VAPLRGEGVEACGGAVVRILGAPWVRSRVRRAVGLVAVAVEGMRCAVMLKP